MKSKTNNKILGLKCVYCQKEYGIREVAYVCPACKNNLDVVYDYPEIKKQFTRKMLAENNNLNQWRYWDILPFESAFQESCERLPTLPIGWTHLHKTTNFGKKYGFENLFFKDDTKTPSGSFKDRASSALVVKGQELKVKTITTASTGNAGCALACVCANLQFPCVIFVPETAPKAKIAQLLIFGAKVVSVKGTYDDAFDLSLKASEEFGWYCRSTGYNPYTREGKKTAALEICEQLGWKTPDKVFVPIGDGNMISGIWKGFKDFYELGFINKLPQLIGVQSNKSNAISKAVQTYEKNHSSSKLDISKIKIEPVNATTIADSISVDLPRDGIAAVRAVIESQGCVVEVEDQDILNAIKTIAQTEGIFTEPAGSTSIAGLMKMIEMKKADSSQKIVCLVTGNGLKDTQSAMKVAGEPISIKPEMEELRKISKNWL